MSYFVHNLFSVCPAASVKAFHREKKHGLTLVEMVIALSLMTIVFASVVPLFGQMRDSWDFRQSAADTLQNGRVLIDHLQRNLAEAVKITAVSDSSETNGFIEFENDDAEIYRYDIDGSSGYVEFGQTGNLSELAGPVSMLKFTCFDACDLDTPISDVDSTRFVKIETVFINALDAGQDETFTTAIYLRTNGNSISGPGTVTQTMYDYSNREQGTNIFAYDGEDNVQAPAVSTSPTNLFSAGEYDDIEFDDETFHTYTTVENSKYGQMRFVIKIDENKNDVTQIVASFNGKGINSKKNDADGVSLYIWNYALSQYELLETSADTEDEITISGILTTSLSDYIGDTTQDTIMLLAATNGKKPNKESLDLMADYVKLDITAAIGGGGEIYP